MRKSRSQRYEKYGFSYFWFLNDDCEKGHFRRQLKAFQAAGVASLVLHGRDGLLLPYGGKDWFDLVRWLCQECVRHGIEPILYDDDPYPSGNAGGRLVSERPEYAGCEIQRFEATEEQISQRLFVFPTGRLCWAGILSSRSRDLTANVGMVRTHWEKAEWDSRWYCPILPVNPHPRAFALHAEFGLRCPKIPQGAKLVAYVARPLTADTPWGMSVDSLNPQATAHFLDLTHERYRRSLGPMLGRTVRAIFADEPKPHSSRPWTPGLFEDFQDRYGYDLRLHLECIFTEGSDIHDARVRRDYREWVSARFERSWLRPVSRWCRQHGLRLIGHISPEEDPINQANTIGNYFPLQKYFSLSGFDLIVPKAGEEEYAITNIAAIAAVSTAQQERRDGVCCESLGACGNISAGQAGKLLAWQILHGVTLPVLHGAFSSEVGLRRYEAPPNYGPGSSLWETMVVYIKKLSPILSSMQGAVQIAPTAILWPVASFQAEGLKWNSGNVPGMRRDLIALLQCCLDHQVGLHFLDEDAFRRVRLDRGKLTLGKASYQTIILPSLRLLEGSTLALLEKAMAHGISVLGVGDAPSWIRKNGKIFKRRACWPWQTVSLEALRSSKLDGLMRSLTIQGDGKEIHATRWKIGRHERLLLMNVSARSRNVSSPEFTGAMRNGELVCLERRGEEWRLLQRFQPIRSASPRDTRQVRFATWRIKLGGKTIRTAKHPLAAHQVLKFGGEKIVSILTQGMTCGGERLETDLIYEVMVRFPALSGTPKLWLEPTLFRGTFTLLIGRNSWQFTVNDTQAAAEILLLPSSVRGREVCLRFRLHRPEAEDGIKALPKISIAAD